MTCDNCHEPSHGLYSANGQWVCFACVPEDIRAMYPGWTEREEKRDARAARARVNFGHTEEREAA